MLGDEMAETEWPESASWDGGSTSCETCGTNWDQAEFYFDDQSEEWWGSLHIGCYGGETIETKEWPEVEAWLERWNHLAGWATFEKDVKELFEKTQMERF